MIQSITMRGIKAANGVQELTGRDIITGPNGAGKTTRAQALGIALMGYVPGNGKLPAETMKLAHGNNMTIGIQTEAFSVFRNFERKGQDIKQSVILTPPNGEKTAAAKEKRIEAELGKLPVMLDFGEFLNLTDMKRREFIYRLAADSNAPESAGKNYVVEQLLQQLVPQLAPEGSSDQTALDIAINSIGECSKAYPDSAGIQAGLQAMVEYAKEQTSFWKKEHEKSVGASQKISEYKNDLAQTDRSLDANNKRLEAAHLELTQVFSEKATADNENLRVFEYNGKISSIKAEISAIEQSVNDGNIGELRDLITQYNSDLRQVDNSAQIAAITASIEMSRAQIEKLRLDTENCRGEYLAIKGKKEANETLLTKLMSQSGTCPIDCRIECDKDFSALIEELNAETMGYEKALEEISRRGCATKENHNAACQAAQEAQNAINRLRQDEIAALRENEQIQAIVREIEGDIARIESFDSTKAARIAAKREELQRVMPKNGEPEWRVTDTEPLNGKIATLQNEIQNLKTKIAEQTKVRNTLANLKSSMIDSTVAGYHVETWKLIAEAVGPKGLQGELVKDVLAPLTESIQEKLRQMSVDREFYFQTEDGSGKEVFQFGWRGDDGEHRNFDALSTGEQMLILIALMTTIIERMNPPLKVLMIDNAENLDHDNLMRVLNGLTTAGANLDNILFSGVMSVDPAGVDGWRVWDLNIPDTASGIDGEQVNYGG